MISKVKEDKTGFNFRDNYCGIFKVVLLFLVVVAIFEIPAISNYLRFKNFDKQIQGEFIGYKEHIQPAQGFEGAKLVVTKYEVDYLFRIKGVLYLEKKFFSPNAVDRNCILKIENEETSLMVSYSSKDPNRNTIDLTCKSK